MINNVVVKRPPTGRVLVLEKKKKKREKEREREREREINLLGLLKNKPSGYFLDGLLDD